MIKRGRGQEVQLVRRREGGQERQREGYQRGLGIEKSGPG